MRVRSTTPQAIRSRARKAGAKINQAVTDLTMVDGYKPLEDWTLEELARGKPRNPDGTWRGGKPLTWITPAIAAEAKRRLLEEGFAELASNLGNAIKVLVDLMTNEDVDSNGKFIVDPRTRFAAAQLVIEHVLGKPRQAIQVDTKEGYRDFLASALVLTDGTPAHPVINGAIVDDEGES